MIRPMTKPDIPRVAEIHIFAWRCAYRGIISDEHLFKQRLVSTQMEKLTEKLNSKTENDENTCESANESIFTNMSETYVYDDGIVRAFMTVGVCGDEDRPLAFELYALYVDPCMQGGGVGTALARYCEAVARERNFAEICIWAFEKNTAARAFYEKLGYELDGKTQVVEPYGAVGVRYHKRLTSM